jgi:3-deoxy-D-manno-octulosonic-acid transferase
MVILPEAVAQIAFGGYRLFGLVMRPAVPFFLSYRSARGKEDHERAPERYGLASRERPSGRVVWLHAASVGETNAALPLINGLVDGGLSVVLTTTTLTSAAVAARRLPTGAVHQFVPLDITSFVDKFLAHWKPELAVFMESELWPNMIGRTAANGIPLVIVNGRLSERSFNSWRRFRPAARLLLSSIRLCLAQSERDAERYASLGALNVVVTGNLKYDTPLPPADMAEVEDFRTRIAGRPVWIAASTHDGEEAIAAETHRRMAERHPGLLTIIVPRHPERGGAIRDALTGMGLRVAQRSRDENVDGEVEIYVGDTLGEMGFFYRLTKVAFLGGSLVRHGGQNPIEPFSVGTAVVHGPHVHNFGEVYRALDTATPWGAVEDAGELAAIVGRLLDDPGEAEASAQRAQLILDRHTGALDATIAALEDIIGSVSRDAQST